MVTLVLEADQWPSGLEDALRARAKVRGMAFEDLIAEVLTAFVEKREPEFKREDGCSTEKSL